MAVWNDILGRVRDLIDAAALAGLPAGNVLVRKLPGPDDTLDSLPLVTVCPAEAGEEVRPMPTGVRNVLYPVQITIIRAGDGDRVTGLDTMLLWREQIRNLFIRPGVVAVVVPTVWRAQWEGQAPFDRALLSRNYDYAPFVIRFTSLGALTMAETPTLHIAQPADGSKFEYSSNGTTWVEVTELRSMQMPRNTRGKVPASTLNTPARFKRKRKGWRDSDDLEIRVAATAAGIAELYALYEDDGDDLYLRHTYPLAVDGTSGGTWTYRGWLVSMNMGDVSVETDELVDVTFNVCVNSVPVYGAPT